MTDEKQQARRVVSNDAATPRGMAYQLGARDAHFTTQITQQSNVKTYKAEGILEGESLPLGVLGVGGCRGNARKRATMPCRAEYSCLSGIILFLHFDGHEQ